MRTAGAAAFPETSRHQGHSVARVAASRPGTNPARVPSVPYNRRSVSWHEKLIQEVPVTFTMSVADEYTHHVYLQKPESFLAYRVYSNRRKSRFKGLNLPVLEPLAGHRHAVPKHAALVSHMTAHGKPAT